MSVGSVNSNVTFGQQQPVKKSNAKRTAAYIGAGIGTAAAITGAIVYRKNIASAFNTLKDMFTPLKTSIADGMADIAGNVKGKAKKVAKNVQNKVEEGVDALKEKAEPVKEKIKNTANDVKDKVDEGVDALKDKAKQVKEEVKEKVANSETAQNIKNETKSFFKKTGEVLKNVFTKTWDYTKQAFNWVKDKVVGFFKEINTFLSNMKKEAAEQVTESAK